MKYILSNLFICFFISIISCKRSELIGEDCQSHDDSKLIAQNFDSVKYINFDFLILFNHHDSWGTYSNSIKIFRQNHEYKLERSFVLRKTRSSIRDTTYSVSILSNEKLDSLMIKIDQLGCHPYRIDEDGQQIDGNYKYLVYKKENLIKGWMWQDGYRSVDSTGERFVDSLKVKVLALEGMLYRFSGAGWPNVAYSFGSGCKNDSIKVYIYPILGDYISQAVHANHPKYKFETNVDGYIEGTIYCRDTVSFTKDLDITVTTKETNKILIEPKQLVSDH